MATFTSNFYLPIAIHCNSTHFVITNCEKHYNFFSDWLTSIKLPTCMIRISERVCFMCCTQRPQSELNLWLFYNWRWVIIIYKVKRAQLIKKNPWQERAKSMNDFCNSFATIDGNERTIQISEPNEACYKYSSLYTRKIKNSNSDKTILQYDRSNAVKIRDILLSKLTEYSVSKKSK